mmetsp:Transcript_5281/g.7760  ORF Transcript_5281/g.7760 Transcript_5281/m.7760 type:complete len:286 (+) Transcript_5281:3-860(+)
MISNEGNRMCTDEELRAYRHAVNICTKKNESNELTEEDMDDLINKATPILRNAVLKQFQAALEVAGVVIPKDQPTKRSLNCKSIQIKRVPLATAVAAGKKGVITLEEGTGGSFELKINPIIRPGHMRLSVKLSVSLLVSVILDVDDSIYYNLPMCLGSEGAYCRPCLNHPPSKCCESPDGCCVKPNHGYCWTQPYYTLRPRRIGAELPLMASFNDIISVQDPSIVGMTVGFANEPELKLKATIYCCREWICFPLFQMLNCCLNRCLFPFLLSKISESLNNLTYTF